MLRSRHRPSDARIDAGWPHQVALPDDLCCQPNFETILAWFKEHGVEWMIRNVQAIWPNRHEENWRLHCFRDPADAAAFLADFGGVPFDPKRDRDNGRARGAWRRTDEYHRIVESGPLKINPIFLREPGNIEYD